MSEQVVIFDFAYMTIKYAKSEPITDLTRKIRAVANRLFNNTEYRFIFLHN